MPSALPQLPTLGHIHAHGPWARCGHAGHTLPLATLACRRHEHMQDLPAVWSHPKTAPRWSRAPQEQDGVRAEQRAADHEAPLQMSRFWITKCRHLQLLQSQSWASLLSIPQLPCSFGPAPEGTDAVMGRRGSSDILWGMEDSHSQLHSHCCIQIQLEKAQKFLCALSEKQVPGAGQQIILCSEGSGKSHVLLSLAKSCKADFSCPPLAFRPPLRVLLMKSLTPIWEIAVFAKHALPCYQKSF